MQTLDRRTGTEEREKFVREQLRQMPSHVIQFAIEYLSGSSNTMLGEIAAQNLLSVAGGQKDLVMDLLTRPCKNEAKA